MADVFCPEFFSIDVENVTFTQLSRKQLKEGETYLMMFETIDDDTFEVIPENLAVAQKIEKQIWIGLRTLVVVKYLGTGKFGKHKFVSGKDVFIETI